MLGSGQKPRLKSILLSRSALQIRDSFGFSERPLKMCIWPVCSSCRRFSTAHVDYFGFIILLFFLTELHHILREELWGLCVCKGGTQVRKDAKVERAIKQPHSIKCWAGQWGVGVRDGKDEQRDVEGARINAPSLRLFSHFTPTAAWMP